MSETNGISLGPTELDVRGLRRELDNLIPSGKNYTEL